VYKQTVIRSIISPKTTFWLIGVVTLLLATAFPFVEVDVDPEAMLSNDEPVRIYHNEIKKKMGLHGFIFMGITRDEFALMPFINQAIIG